MDYEFTIREGSAYSLGGGALLVWGGAPNRSGALPADGLLVDLETGVSLRTQPAPFGGRYLPAVVWTGAEFLIVGGHDFDGAFVDGGALNPATGSWESIPAAPVVASQHPSSVWTGQLMFVWFPSHPARFGELPDPGFGQLVSYDPVTRVWAQYPPPPAEIVDAVLVPRDGNILLIGGPLMRDVGTGGSDHQLIATTLDLQSGEWTDPILGPRTEAARLLTHGPAEVASVITAEGDIWELSLTWELSAAVDGDCWRAVAAASSTINSYVRNCDVYLVDGSSLRALTDDREGTHAVNTYGSAFLAGADGQLIVVRDKGAGTEPTGSIVIQVYDPRDE